MTGLSNAQLARKWFEDVWNVRRDATMHELLHPEMVGQMEGLEVRAAADFVRAREAILDALPDLRVEVEDVVSEGNQAVVRWSATGTHRGDGLGIPASKRPASFRGMTWLVFSEGRIVKGWDSWNQGLLLQQLTMSAGDSEIPAAPPTARRG
jgi:steroid delta-isomerase-like uncharacterized protein